MTNEELQLALLAIMDDPYTDEGERDTLRLAARRLRAAEELSLSATAYFAERSASHTTTGRLMDARNRMQAALAAWTAANAEESK